MAASIKWFALDLPFISQERRNHVNMNPKSKNPKPEVLQSLKLLVTKMQVCSPSGCNYKVYADNRIWINSALGFESDPQSLRNTCMCSQVWNMCGPKNLGQRTVSTVSLKRISVTNTKIDRKTNSLPDSYLTHLFSGNKNLYQTETSAPEQHKIKMFNTDTQHLVPSMQPLVNSAIVS